MLLLISIPQLMHGAFVSQTMQVKILNKVKEITANTGNEENSETLKAVQSYVGQLISAQITKISENQKAPKAKDEKKAAQPKDDKAKDLKAVKKQFGKKRTLADKAEDGDNEDSANNRKQRT